MGTGSGPPSPPWMTGVSSWAHPATKPGNVLVTWPLLNSQTDNWQATIGWPTNYSRFQIHVAGPTPVDVSGGGAFSNVVVHATTTDVNPDSVRSTRLFSAQTPGLSLLMLSAGDPSNNPIRFQFVRTIAWNDPAYLLDNVAATIGQPVLDPGGYHDPACGSPQVILPGGVYCPAPVFDIATRTGTIIPVNKDNPETEADDLVVAFYRRGTLLYDPTTGLAVSNNICWPHKPVRFSPQWPTNAAKIVIASQQGTGPIDPIRFANWELYYQNDPNQAGFNPNDEHALRRPLAAGDAVFALR